MVAEEEGEGIVAVQSQTCVRVRVGGSRFGVFRVEGLEFRVKVLGLGFRVQSSRFSVCTCTCPEEYAAGGRPKP